MKPNNKPYPPTFYDGRATLIYPRRKPSRLRAKLFIALVAIAVLYTWLLSVPTYPDVIDIQQDRQGIKRQIVNHIPIGTDIARAAQFMRANRFSCEWNKKGWTLDGGSKWYRTTDELYCQRDDGFIVGRGCKAIFELKNGCVTAITVGVGNTGP